MAKKEEELEELKHLSPEERLAKLKEIEEKSKKEIEEAQKLIKQSEEEISEKKKFEEKVPIPQLISEEGRGLETSEEKEMFEAQREKARKQVKEKAPEEKKKASLEEQIESEHIEELARKPAEELKEMMGDIYKRAEEQGGYMSREQREEIYSITKAEGEKIYAMKEGQYPSEQMAGALESISATFSMGKKLRQMYEAKGDEGGADYQRNIY